MPELYLELAMKNRLILCVGLFLLLTAFVADKPVITIFMIGDSTMANKNITGGNPERGWGMVLPGFFAEDINEQVYKIDKMFTQLFNIKQFRNNIQAIILGEFLDSGNQVWLDELFEEIASTHNIPVVSGFKITHGKDKLTLPIGAGASLIDGELLIK